MWRQKIAFDALNGAPAFTETQSYAYSDPANRLSQASTPLWSQPNGYDQWGNRWVNNPTGLPTMSADTPTAQSWFTSNNNRVTGFNYDAMGNVQSKTGMSWSYLYDGENRQVQATNVVAGANVTTNYTYDGDGRRVIKTTPGTDPVTHQTTTFTTTYIYDASGQLAQEYSTAPATDSGTSYLTADHLGSTRLITDGSSGMMKKRFDYLPFGEELTAGTGGRTAAMGYNDSVSVTVPDMQSMKFTSKERDAETGLDYFGARYFSGALGRFTSPDWSESPEPVPYADLSDPQTLNLYSYVRNNPLAHVDADGHQDPVIPDKQTVKNYVHDLVTGYLKGAVNAYLDDKGVGVGSILRAAGVERQVASTPMEAAGMAAEPYVTTGLAIAAPGPKGAKGETLPDDAIVVRGGTNKPENFLNGTGVKVDANGNLSGVSVNSAPGKSEVELSQGIWNNQVGVTTVGTVRAAGGDVAPKPTINNPYHCEMCGVSATEASGTMTVKPNPAKIKEPKQ